MVINSADDKGKLKASPPLTIFDADTLGDDESPWCLICLSSPIEDRTVLPACTHSQFCLQCILRWSDVKRRCPLCQADIGSYVIHHISHDDDQDHIRYHLRPQPDVLIKTENGASTSQLSRRAVVERVQAARQQRRLRSSTRPAQAEEDGAGDLQAAVAFRRSIYVPRHLYAKHVGSNRHTHYTSCPSAAAIRQTLSSEPHGKLHSRLSAFVRRELQVWTDVDHSFLTTYVLALVRVLPIGSDESVNLLAEFLGYDNALHFWHELECFLRSGKTELRNYDRSPLLQYGIEYAETQQKTQTVAASDALVSPTPLPFSPTPSWSSWPTTPSRADIADLRRRTLLHRLEAEKAKLPLQYPDI